MPTRASYAAACAAQDAAKAWEKAPIHVKAMAGPYVKPLLTAVMALAMAAEGADARMDAMTGIGGQQPEQGNGKT